MEDEPDELAAFEEPRTPVDSEWQKRIGSKRDKERSLVSPKHANGLTFTDNRKRLDALVRLFDTIATASDVPLTEVIAPSTSLRC